MNHIFDKDYLQSLYCQCVNLCGPRKSGKTTWLNEARGYYSDNGHPVIYMDFSDCRINNYEKFVLYIKKKMSKVYLDVFKCFDKPTVYYQTIEHALKIITGECNEEELRESLQFIVNYYRGRLQQRDKRAMIFIDEISKPLLYAAKYDFLEDVYDFYDDFLDIDHYELSGGILTTSFLPAEVECQFYLKYISSKHVRNVKPIADYCVNEGINIGVEAEMDMGWYRTYAVTESMKKYFQTILVLSDENGSASPDYDIALDDETKAHIARMRAWVAEEKMLEAERKRIAKEKEIAEYATLYEDNGQVPSSFVGLRNLDINVEVCPKYEAINNILKEAYKALGRDTHFSGVYDYFQKLGQDEEIIEGVNKVLCELKEKADALETIKSCNISLHDVYWGRFDVQRTDEKRNVSDLALIKMYLSAKDISDALAIFYDAVEFMIEEGRGLFHAKVTRISRDDQICMWVTREDFFVLEKYLKKYEDLLHRPLQFIPYRGSIGISREFYDWTSHNGVQAQLISTYFSSVDSVEKIDVVDMYSKYVKAWNGEFPEGDVFTRKFKESNAQEFIILIESFSLLFGKTIIDDNNILLNGDGKLWHALGCSNNWYQLNKNLQIA